RERHPLGVAGQKLGEPGLMERNLAAGERVDLLGDHVAGHHAMAELGEAGGGDEADPADSDHPYGRSVGHLALWCRFRCGRVRSTLVAIPIISLRVSASSRLFDTQ